MAKSQSLVMAVRNCNDGVFFILIYFKFFLLNFADI